MCVCVCVCTYNKKCVCIYMCVCGGGCFDKYISAITLPLQTKIPDSALCAEECLSPRVG